MDGTNRGHFDFPGIRILLRRPHGGSQTTLGSFVLLHAVCIHLPGHRHPGTRARRLFLSEVQTGDGISADGALSFLSTIDPVGHHDSLSGKDHHPDHPDHRGPGRPIVRHQHSRKCGGDRVDQLCPDPTPSEHLHHAHGGRHRNRSGCRLFPDV